MFARTEPGQAGQPDYHDPVAGHMALQELRQRRQSPHGPTAHMWRGDIGQLLYGGVCRKAGEVPRDESDSPVWRFSYNGLSESDDDHE